MKIEIDLDAVAGWRLGWIRTLWLGGNWDGSGHGGWMKIGMNPGVVAGWKLERMDPDVVAGWRLKIAEAGLIACGPRTLLLEIAEAGLVACGRRTLLLEFGIDLDVVAGWRLEGMDPDAVQVVVADVVVACLQFIRVVFIVADVAIDTSRGSRRYWKRIRTRLLEINDPNGVAERG